MNMSSISENIEAVKEKIASAASASGRSKDDVLLVAVTKTHGADMINEAIDCGITDIGENKVQEILEKYDSVKKGVRWHLIGHLQTNKVKYIIDKVSLIHSVDSIKLMDEIDRQAKKHKLVMDILIQINISGEETKFGIRPEQLDEFLRHASTLGNIRVMGLMTIAPKTNNSVTSRLHFDNIKAIYLDNRAKIYDNVNMKYLSMGMSGDYEVAIECGANIVRVGSAIFGKRFYDI